MTSKALRLVSQIITLWLILIAGIVAALLGFGKSPWLLIVAYWITLTLKNLIDLMARLKEEEERDTE